MFPTIKEALKQFVESDAYPYLIETMRQKYLKEITDADINDFDQLTTAHVKLKTLLAFDKEVRIILDSLKIK